MEECLPSTNDLLLRLAAAGEGGGLAVLARTQTAGRGTNGRAWASPPGNLYLSLLLRPGGRARDAGRYALLAAVALTEALASCIPDSAALRLKWPNDVLLGPAKLAGILCESAATETGSLDWIVIGIGANLAHAPALPDRPTACIAHHAPPPLPEPLALRILHAVAAWQQRLADHGLAPLLAAWAARGPEHGAWLTLRNGAAVTTGSYQGLDTDGALLLETEGRVRRFASGELSA